MSAMSNYVENLLVDYFLRGMAMPAPLSLIYISLHSGSPGDTGANEFSGNSYARASIVAAYNTWESTQGSVVNEVSSGTTGVSKNKVVISFPTPTPNGWGTATSFGIWAASSGGLFLFGAPLQSPKTIDANDSVTFPVDALVGTFA